MQKSKTQFDVFEGNKDTNIILFPLLKELTVDIDEENWDSQSLYTFLNTPQTFCFVINKAVNPVGFALIRLAHDEAEIIYLKTIKKYRSKGYANSLLKYFFKWAKIKSISKIFLEVSVENFIAIKLYKSNGFFEVGLREKYYIKNSKKEDAKVMLKTLIMFDE
ncbi:GNAT family N-acetyltransferase [Alphaproteobacteria bacterium]|nr:GNAT family N-acetyltransferase [Alphaproteobacteria bacterium]